MPLVGYNKAHMTQLLPQFQAHPAAAQQANALKCAMQSSITSHQMHQAGGWFVCPVGVFGCKQLGTATAPMHTDVPGAAVARVVPGGVPTGVLLLLTGQQPAAVVPHLYWSRAPPTQPPCRSQASGVPPSCWFNGCASPGVGLAMAECSGWSGVQRSSRGTDEVCRVSESMYVHRNTGAGGLAGSWDRARCGSWRAARHHSRQGNQAFVSSMARCTCSRLHHNVSVGSAPCVTLGWWVGGCESI
jgi:hypothetical protein